MRLDRLEISGFKSFSDRTELRFDRGVTAIVGPNGCGKSNVVDAIAWVLGEQSAKSLRGDRMEDVIFSGSDARKATGAAEVRLHLAGARWLPRGGGGDGARMTPAPRDAASEVLFAAGPSAISGIALDDEPLPRDVEVTRRLFRSGESEYLIDGEICRLRDVHDLFIDSGVGVKAYAFIEQGKVGALLSARPAERRQIIEEAAGVTKYKVRRRAAELKLEAAKGNLTRIDDIVFELEKQLASLKRQAARARRYRKLRDELRRWEKRLFARRYEALSTAIAAAQERLAAARTAEQLAAARLDDADVRREALSASLADALADAARTRETLHTGELSIERLRQTIASDRRESEALEARCDGARVEIDALAAKREPIHAELDERRRAAARAHLERDAAADAAAAANEEHALGQRGLEGLESDVEAARSEVFAAIHAAAALRHAVDHAVAAGERVSEELSKLGVEASSLRIEAERASTAHAGATDACAAVRAALDGLRGQRGGREADGVATRGRRDESARRLRALEHDLAAARARLVSLEELDAARAGYGDAARLVLAETNGDVSHRGSVADYLEVDQRYERAVEACLGDFLQYVIVDSHAHAAAGLAFVRERNAGRCGFLVRSTAERNGEGAASALESAPDAQALADVVRVGGPYEDVIRRAMEPAWIVASFERAAAVASATSARAASLGGDLCRGAHIAAGGDRGDARGILAIKREIKELRDRAPVLEEEVSRRARDLDALDAELARIDAAIAALAEEEHLAEKSIVQHEADMARAHQDVRRTQSALDQVDVERRAAEAERKVLSDREDEARASILALETQQRDADARLAGAQRRLFAARDSVEALARTVAEAGATHAALVERAAAAASDVQRIEETAADLDGRIEAVRREIDEAQGRVQALTLAIAQQQDRLAAEEIEIEASRVSLTQANERVAGLQAGAHAAEVEIRDARAALDAVRAKATALDIERATAEADLSHLAASCAEVVQASLDDVAAEVAQWPADETPAIDVAQQDADADADADEDMDAPTVIAATAAAHRAASAEDVIAELKGRIDRLGPVNMMAIEQCDELETRHVFLTGQRADLIESIASTGEAIKRIDLTTIERFRDAFESINLNFQTAFTTLFGGGRAGLTLIDETDLLESGVDIIAQPPGKRLQNVQLLSGGEKAMTAIALMFGIFKYRPSPFCLLDEIDAPLDDANIGRFVQMLQAMQTDTQFVLITHNRRTMEIADRLYGVTMEEPGVSKLISVQMN